MWPVINSIGVISWPRAEIPEPGPPHLNVIGLFHLYLYKGELHLKPFEVHIGWLISDFINSMYCYSTDF